MVVGVLNQLPCNPRSVEVGLDWIELKLGWMLGWVVTIFSFQVVPTGRPPPATQPAPPIDIACNQPIIL